VLQDHRHDQPISRTCHDEDYDNNYTHEATDSGDTSATLARAIRALTLRDAEDEASTDCGIGIVLGRHLLEPGGGGYNFSGHSSVRYHGSQSGVHGPAMEKRRYYRIHDESAIPRRSTGLSPEEGKGANLDHIVDASNDGDDCHHTEHQVEETTYLSPPARESGSSKELLHSESASDNEANREHNLLCLGTWQTTDPDDPADNPRPFAKDLPPSEIETTFHSYNNSTAGFNQCGVDGSGSRGQGRQLLSASSNTPWNSQVQNFSGIWKGKRPSGDGGDEEGDDGQSNKRMRGDDTPVKTPSQRFACPFQKYDPGEFYYDGTKGRHRSCIGGFLTIARLK